MKVCLRYRTWFLDISLYLSIYLVAVVYIYLSIWRCLTICIILLIYISIALSRFRVRLERMSQVMFEGLWLNASNSSLITLYPLQYSPLCLITPYPLQYSPLCLITLSPSVLASVSHYSIPFSTRLCVSLLYPLQYLPM